MKCTYLMMLIGVIGSNAKGRAELIADLLGHCVPLRTGAGWILALAVVSGKGSGWMGLVSSFQYG